jgi:hypothetical protein
MRQIATAAGLGSAALEYIGESQERTEKFRSWCEARYPAGPHPAEAAAFAKALEVAALACAGLNNAFKDAA